LEIVIFKQLLDRTGSSLKKSGLILATRLLMPVVSLMGHKLQKLGVVTLPSGSSW
jgi:hypothetical protein